MMKHAWIFAALLLLAGCGYTSRDNELTGQAKKIENYTPLICQDYKAFDISLGVMQGGTGSMSTQDKWLTIADEKLIPALEQAVSKGSIVKIYYNERRFTWCQPNAIITSVEVVKE